MKKSLLTFDNISIETKNFLFTAEGHSGYRGFLACFFMMDHAMEFAKHYEDWCSDECLKAIEGGEVEFAKYVEKYGKVVFADYSGMKYCVELI